MGQKAKRRLGQCMACLAALLLMILPGCGRRQANIQVFQYTQNDDGTIDITGLTDKGKTDSQITIPSEIDGMKVAAISGEAFRDCSSLHSVVFEEGVESIEANAFLNCVNLETIEFPQSLRTVGTNAVKNTKWEQNVLAEHDAVVVNDILVEVYSDASKYTVQDGIRAVASGAFYSNTSVQEIELPDSVEQIGTYAFAGCTSLSSITLPDGLKRIEYGAFSGCTALEAEVPKQAEYIGQDAFLDVSVIIYNGSLPGAPWGALSLESEGE